MTRPGERDRAEAWHRIVSGEATGGSARLARALLGAGARLYGVGVTANRALYDRGIIRPSRATQFILGVGNLTLGGTGKTTASQFLARTLEHGGLRPAVVLRGYRRSGAKPLQLVSDGRGTLVSVQEAGDEAFMLARALPGVAVAVGKKRERVCDELLRGIADVVILDDAFQYWRLAKDYEIVLIDSTRPDDLARIFPAGVLREPLGALRRASAVWLTRCDQAEAGALSRLRGIARDATGEAAVETRHRPVGLRELTSGEGVPLESLKGRTVGAVSSVGNPFSFEQSLRDLGAGRVLPVRFPDHHTYTAEEVSEALRSVRNEGAEVVVTTEKDAVRLPMVAGLESVCILTVELEVLAGGESIENLLAMAERARDEP